MLIDDVIQTTRHYLAEMEHGGMPVRGVPSWLHDLESAPVFAIEADVAVFLDTLVVDMTNTLASFKDVRLPHQNFFVEYPFAVLNHARSLRTGIEPKAGDFVPERVGVFIRSYNGATHATATWRAPPDQDTTSNMKAPAVGPLFEADVGTMEAMPERSAYSVRLDTDAFNWLLLSREDAGDNAGNFIRDLITELPLILAFLLFLSSPDHETLSEDRVEPSAKLNAKRQRAGRAPLRPYRLIKLGDYGRMHMAAIGEDRAGRRAHHVRGHYMRSHGKMVWRRPHVRGVSHDSADPPVPRARIVLGDDLAP